MGDYAIGFEYISDTAAHTGRFNKLVAFEDSVIASAVIQNVTGNASPACHSRLVMLLRPCSPASR